MEDAARPWTTQADLASVGQLPARDVPWPAACSDRCGESHQEQHERAPRRDTDQLPNALRIRSQHQHRGGHEQQPGGQGADARGGLVAPSQCRVRALHVERGQAAQDVAAVRRELRPFLVHQFQVTRQVVGPRLSGKVGTVGQLRPLERVGRPIGGHGETGPTQGDEGECHGPPQAQQQRARPVGGRGMCGWSGHRAESRSRRGRFAAVRSGYE